MDNSTGAACVSIAIALTAIPPAPSPPQPPPTPLVRPAVEAYRPVYYRQYRPVLMTPAPFYGGACVGSR